MASKPNNKIWIPCPICTGRFAYQAKPEYKLTVGTKKIRICAWCYGRGGKFILLFIQFVEQFSTKPCERYVMPLSQESLSCKCPPCTAQRILNYRERIVGRQVAPIKGI